MKLRRRSFCEKKEDCHTASLPLIEALSEAQMVMMEEKVRDAVAMRQRSQTSPFWDLVSGLLLGTSSPVSDSTSSSSSSSSISSTSASTEIDPKREEEEEVAKKGDETYYYNVLLCDRAGGSVGLPVALVFSSKRLKVLRRGSDDVMWSIPFSNIELFRLLAEDATLSLRFCPLGMQTYHTLYFYSSRVVEMYGCLVALINAEIVARFEMAKAKRIEKSLTPR